ncbi:GNAT family N-acetyltransferase [Enterobacteriaceae bacterium RIT814]|uniref:GNAT family N-acetyltransferase n=1 Tax=Leclercia TaxID=83654 RepID=UPI0005009343|nr:GNAT family N-acetyltransferase [Leclercia pneumoniae]KGB03301.1 acetyltransferase domain protein [Enterobacteriaceae bacterium ATCC 29904]MBM6608640.1 GNAT family N-acetyltransferase [Enterobacteriaceae bacterium RIT 814]MCE6962812.1 GNAT family N-acetyltransferase [Enterobacter sp. MW07]MCV2511810.1 GNAT family N-acetyltransferase [Leclercia pneumoniae]WNN80273.1 GNAT family N-acetyltransferase [Leclercia pneumoniae]
MSVTIRQASPQDADAIYNMINGLSVYRESPKEAVPDVEDIRTSLFSADTAAEAYICEVDGNVAGYSVVSMSYSTWLGRYSLNMEDLYFIPDYRGLGAGKAMLQYIAQLAVSRKCSRIEWNVLEWDKSAKDFYLSIDALPLSEWVRYRLDGPALERFATREII